MAKNVKVADYIGQQILLSGKAQREIAAEIGYDKPNVITMFKQGTTKVPMNKVALLAKSLGVDPLHLLRLVMSEYMPETWAIISDILKAEDTMTQSEAKILSIVRNSANGQDVMPETDEEVLELMNLVDGWRERRMKVVKAAAANSRQKLDLE